jgi:ubiquitin C-terminal hydrolase
MRPPSAQINNNYNNNNLNQQQFMNRPQVRIPTPKNNYNEYNNDNNYRIPTPKNNEKNPMYSNPNNLSVNDVYNNIMNPQKQDICPTYKSYNGPNYHMINPNYNNQNNIQQPSYDQQQQINQYNNNQQIEQPPIEPQYNNNYNYNNEINDKNNYNNPQDNYNIPPSNEYQNNIAKTNQIYNNNNQNPTPQNNNVKKKTNAFEFLTKVVNSRVGISNILNSTYMSSVLQNLIHCPLFVSKFLEEGIPIFKSKSRDTPVAGCLYNLMVDITKANDFTSVAPNVIKNCIQDIHNEFQDNNQEHDCQEFCRYLIQDINTDLNRITEENKNKKEDNYEGEPNKRYEYELFLKDNLSKENSIITDLFFGYLSFEFACTNCGGREFTFSQFLDLPLQFESNKNIHLNTLLRKNILKKELVEMEDKCSNCHKCNEKEQVIKIAKLPTILILSLQRTDLENNIKNESIVQFDEMMELSELIDNDLIYDNEDNNNRYKLFGVIYLVDGKYISFCFVDGEWYKFNNDVVAKEIPEMNSKNVYSLFYMKI